MKKRVISLGTIVLLVGSLAVFLAGRADRSGQDRPGPGQEELNNLPQMAAAGDPRLADLLNNSLVAIGAGEFIMGSDSGPLDQRPQRPVYLDAFEIDRYEVTNLQYRFFVEAAGRKPPVYWPGEEYPPGQAAYPVVGVSWQDADAYCRWADKRLPAEAEWEKACRGADGQIYPWGNTWDASRGNVSLLDPAASLSDLTGPEAAPRDLMWEYLLAPTSQAESAGLQPVGSYPEGASPYGVMDLVGNASEWVSDWYNWSGYSEMPDRNPFGSGPPWNHCLRGSSWFDSAGSSAGAGASSRCSARNSSHTASDPRVGFRCAR
jgi:formylglycine-generating enzyme required for sulfatase activity